MSISEKVPVVAILLDAADRITIERLIGESRMPYLESLRDSGVYTRIKSGPYMVPERKYSICLTGCDSDKLGFWSPLAFDSDGYFLGRAQYDFKTFKPYYLTSSDYRVAIFELPNGDLIPELNGIQVYNWGAHADWKPSRSLPASLIDEIWEKHGRSPVYNRDYAEIDDPDSLLDLMSRLTESLSMRCNIIRDLIAREHWDLFTAEFSELHSGTHYFWPHQSLKEVENRPDLAKMRDQLYEAVDTALGAVLGAQPDARVIVYSYEGMESNKQDLPSMVLLPELLFRYSLDAVGLDFAPDSVQPSPESEKGIVNWVMEIWNLRRRTGSLSLFLRRHLSHGAVVAVEKLLGIAPTLFQPESFDVENYIPAIWYSPYWLAMRAFALPSFSNGLIRINVRGRDRHGTVSPADFDDTVSQLADMIYRLTDLETGKPAVDEVIRVRTASELDSRRGPDADLIVMWAPGTGHGLVSPDFGVLGPAPIFRAGGHNHDGFMIATGPGIKKTRNILDGDALDIAPTILTAMGAPVPKYMDGKPIPIFEDSMESSRARVAGASIGKDE